MAPEQPGPRRVAVYLAAPYAARDKVRGMAYDVVTTVPLATVTSSWLSETHEVGPGTTGPAANLPDPQVEKHALTDLEDVRRSDVVVLVTAAAVDLGGDSRYGSSGGRHVETGFALALDKKVVVLGEPENVFHRLGRDRVRCRPTWDSVLVTLRNFGLGHW